MNKSFAAIGVGNMAKAIINGIQNSNIDISCIKLFDKNINQYSSLPAGKISYICEDSIANTITDAKYVLLSVKPQNFSEILDEISKNNSSDDEKIYITIAAGITSKSVSDALNGANVIRVLPNLPMTVGKGVSVICKNDQIPKREFDFVCSIFEAAGSVIIIDEKDMNPMIGVTSSSPAYVFKFIDCIYKSALAQGLDSKELLSAICDVFIGAASLLKQSGETPDTLISMVSSKGGTTERAISEMNSFNIDNIIHSAMCACTKRAEELGKT